MKGMLLCVVLVALPEKPSRCRARNITRISTCRSRPRKISQETKRNRPVRASSHTHYFFSFLFFRAPHSTVSLNDELVLLIGRHLLRDFGQVVKNHMMRTCCSSISAFVPPILPIRREKGERSLVLGFGEFQ